MNKQQVHLTGDVLETARQNPGSEILLADGRRVSHWYVARLIAQIEQMNAGFEVGWSVEATHDYMNPVTGAVSHIHFGRVWLRWTEQAAA